MSLTPFSMFGFSHIITVVIIVIITIFALHKLQTYDTASLKKYFNPFLAILLFSQLTLWRIIFIFQNDFTIGYDLPLHLCGLSEILLIYYLLRPGQKLFDVLYYWIMSGSTLAVIIPELQWDFPSARYFALFIPHSLMVFVILYCLTVLKIRPSHNSYWTGFKALGLAALCMAPVNLLLKANFLYLCDIPPVPFGPIKLLPEWPWYLIVLALFFLMLYRIIYQPFYQSATETALDQKEISSN